jgi:hypothetical protein
MVLSNTALSDLSAGLGQIAVVKGSVTMTAGGWAPKVPAGLVVGIRVSVTSGAVDDLANLDVSVKDGNAHSYPVDVSLSSAGQKTVLWLFGVGTGFSSVGRSILVFPSGETVDLGELAVS